jgi:hypothetical protein
VREDVLAGVQRAEQANDPEGIIMLAGEGAALIDAIRPAGEVVRDVVDEAERILRAVNAYVVG